MVVSKNRSIGPNSLVDTVHESMIRWPKRTMRTVYTEYDRIAVSGSVHINQLFALLKVKSFHTSSCVLEAADKSIPLTSYKVTS